MGLWGLSDLLPRRRLLLLWDLWGLLPDLLLPWGLSVLLGLLDPLHRCLPLLPWGLSVLPGLWLPFFLPHPLHPPDLWDPLLLQDLWGPLVLSGPWGLIYKDGSSYPHSRTGSCSKTYCRSSSGRYSICRSSYYYIETNPLQLSYNVYDIIFAGFDTMFLFIYVFNFYLHQYYIPI